MSNLIDRQKAIDTVLKCYDNNELFEVYEDKLRALPAEPHWIPCSERLPEKNGDYLCQEKLGFLYVDTWNGECWDIARSSFGIVVAWMPLPEYYKG